MRARRAAFRETTSESGWEGGIRLRTRVRQSAVLVGLLLGLGGCASARPEAALAGVTAEGELVPLDSLTSSFEASGITVIHRPVYVNDIVAVNLYLLGGSRQLTSRTAGVEALLLGASEYGTRGYPGDRTRRAEGLTGSRLVMQAGADWTRFGFHGLKSEFDSTWAVFADRLMHPTLDSAAVEVVRGRMLTAARRDLDSPDGMVRRLADSIAFGAHPYALPPTGTVASLGAITAADLRSYHDGQMVTSRMLLVVVGDVPRERIEAAVNSTLGTLPRGSYLWEIPPPWRSERAPAGAVAVLERAIPTNYILGYFAGPAASDRDYATFRITTALLGARIHSRIRAEGLSYAAYAPFLERGAAAGGIYVSTVAPARAMRVINEVIEEMRRQPVARASLIYFTDQFVMDYFLSNATNAAQADFLARAHLYRGDYRLASRYMDELRRVTPSAVRSAASRYVRQIRFAYVGNPALVPRRELTRYE